MQAGLAGIPDDAPVMSDAGELVTGVDRDEMRDGTAILGLFLETPGGMT